MWGRKDDPNDPLRATPELPSRPHDVRPIASPPAARPSPVTAAPKAARTGSSIGPTVKLKADITGA